MNSRKLLAKHAAYGLSYIEKRLGGDQKVSKQTVMINGVAYDAATGMRITASSVEKEHTPKSSAVHAHQVHHRTQRSATLARAHVTMPKQHREAKERQIVNHSHIAKSPLVQKFANHPHTPKQHTEAIVQPTRHPLQHAAHHSTARPTKSAHPTAQQIKNHAIAKALSNSKPAPAKKQSRASFGKRHPQLLSAATASLAVVLLAGYVTYANLPTISVRVASAQAGINADYPAYQPSGYSVKGPVSFADGEVAIHFAANTSSEHFTINQSKSSWDSTALLDNYIKQQAPDSNYIAYNDSGLTIYTYGTKAAWVNGGILHTIDGNAQLSGEQVRNIATSM